MKTTTVFMLIRQFDLFQRINIFVAPVGIIVQMYSHHYGWAWWDLGSTFISAAWLICTRK